MRLHNDTCHLFDRADVYEIHVVGTVDERVLEYLAGMTAVRHTGVDDADVIMTVLTGWLPDQAALNGVLNALYDRQYTLVLVRKAQLDSAQTE